jgi:putative two-component system response regulator
MKKKRALDDELTPEVLIIDDSPTIRTYLSKMVKGLGWDLRTAENGREGLDEIAAKKPDLIICDIEMPELDGLGVIEAVKGDTETMLIPLVVLTSAEGRDLKLRALKLGADDYLYKNPEPSELKARLNNLLQLKQYTDQLEDAESILFAISEIVEAKDWFTGKHCERLSVYSVALGSHLGVSPKGLDTLRRAGYLHDMGKIAVHDAILVKPGPLTEEEWEEVHTHPVVGEELCRNMRTAGDVLPLIRHHHENWDGSGYPDGLRGEEIPLLARILQVVDIYDALRSRRSYKPPMPYEEAVRTLRQETEEGKRDPRVVDAFLEIASESNEIEEGYRNEPA